MSFGDCIVLQDQGRGHGAGRGEAPRHREPPAGRRAGLFRRHRALVDTDRRRSARPRARCRDAARGGAGRAARARGDRALSDRGRAGRRAGAAREPARAHPRLRSHRLSGTTAMYQYDAFDRRFLEERVAQYRDQVRRRLAGLLSEDEFKPLRLMNGLYLQLHAYMLRIAIPYGTLAARQLRMLAHVARRYDRGFGHFTTRTNLQFHWIKLEETPDILAELATVELHSIQTSGNSFRNTTTDPFAGAAADEIEDPRPYCEIIRQWATLHPEFSFLPRKFKIAVSAAAHDRAAVKVHDIGLHLRRNDAGEVGFEVLVGGGLGRTPIIGEVVRDFLPKRHLLSYLEAILRVYNQAGRRDNLFKARIKILVQSLGIAKMREAVEAEWTQMDHAALALTDAAIAAMAQHFALPVTEAAPADDAALARAFADKDFALWAERNVAPHKVPGHAIVTISLKPPGKTPGDCTAEQMELVADLADALSHGEIRVTHEQNLVLPHVRRVDLPG